MTQPTTFSVRLRTLRESAGLTQRALADSAGVPQTTIARLELSPGADPQVSTIVRLARALGVTMEHLVGEDAP